MKKNLTLGVAILLIASVFGTVTGVGVEEDDEYCEVDGGDTSDGEYITNVQFNGIDRSSEDDGGYADHTDSVSDPVERGLTYELSVTISTGGYKDYVTVVIDWAQDYDLSNEEVIEVGSGSSDPQTVTTYITVPEDAAEGETRMRVMQEYNEYHYEPCEDQSYGETEDYTVAIAEEDEEEIEEIIDRIREIPGFTTTLLLLASIIAVAIYRKKRTKQ